MDCSVVAVSAAVLQRRGGCVALKDLGEVGLVLKTAVLRDAADGLIGPGKLFGCFVDAHDLHRFGEWSTDVPAEQSREIRWRQPRRSCRIIPTDVVP